MRIRKYFFLLTIPAVAAVTGCNKLKDFGDTNNNQNATSQPLPSALLTHAEAVIGEALPSAQTGYIGAQRGYMTFTLPGLYAQYLSQTQYTDESLYSVPQSNLGPEYSGVLMDLQTIINTNTSKNQTNVAKILQQFVFWTITDRWGDVPYSEALQGSLSPKYDKQEDIYKGMIATLKATVDEFDATSVISGDIVYAGDVAKWKKLANSLRMLMSLQLSKRYPGASDYAATEFKAALNHAAGHISTNADNFTFNYPGGQYKNPWFSVYNGRKDYGESKTMTDLMASLNDARQTVFGGKTELQDKSNAEWDDASAKGVPYGWKRADAEAFTGANPDWARALRGDFREENDPMVLIGAAHVMLARAEAADYGWTSDNLATTYANGITLSYEQWGLPAPVASFFTQAGVALTASAGTGANLQQIAIQRYIASYPNGLQGWNIWRKTGYPTLTPARDATNSSKQIPRRYVYGQSEYGTNKEATEAAAAAIGGDTQDTRVWWDKQ